MSQGRVMGGALAGLILGVGLLLVFSLPLHLEAGHCTISGGEVTGLAQLSSRPGNLLICNSFNARSGVEGQPTFAPGFNPFPLLAVEQQLTSHRTVEAANGQGLVPDNPLCRPIAVEQGGNLASLANCVDRFILSSLQPGQVTGNPFGRLISFAAFANQTAGIQPDDSGVRLFNCGAGAACQPLQSILFPFENGSLTSENNAAFFAVNPAFFVGALLSVRNDSLNSLSVRTVQNTTAGLKSFGMAFGNDFAFNPSPGAARQQAGRNGVLNASVPGANGYLELSSAFCPAATSGRAAVCSRLTVFEEIEGAVGDEAVTQGTGDTSEMILILASFNTSVTGADALNAFDTPVVFWRQRVDEGLFIMDTLGSFTYNRGDIALLSFANATYVTGGSMTNAMHGLASLNTNLPTVSSIPMAGGLSSFANLVSVDNGVCFPGGSAGDTVQGCPGTP